MHLKQASKIKVGLPLHKAIALGKNPSGVQTTKGISKSTVNNIKK